MNQLIRNYIAVKGLDNAMNLAKSLIKADQQVMVQLDDCDIYIVAYADNNLELGGDQFAALTPEEAENIADAREKEKYVAAKELLKGDDGDDDDDEDDEDDEE